MNNELVTATQTRRDIEEEILNKYLKAQSSVNAEFYTTYRATCNLWREVQEYRRVLGLPAGEPDEIMSMYLDWERGELGAG